MKNLTPTSGGLDASRVEEWARITATLTRDVELQLIRIIKNSVARNMGAGRWEVGRLAELATVQAHMLQLLGDKWEHIIDEANQVLQAAHDAGQSQAVTDLEAAGLPATLPTSMGNAIALTARDILSPLMGIPTVILRSTSDIYQMLMAGPVTMVTTGALTRVDATQEALIRWARNGIPGFVDKAGRQWSMDAYAEMAVRTGGMNAMREGYASTLTMSGMDLVRVTGHGYTCPKCAKYQGQVLSLTGNTPNGPQRVLHATEDRHVTVNVVASIPQATEDGLFHPNCGHSHNLYLPGVTTLNRPPANNGTYVASQQQRALELDVRKLKRELAAAFTPEKQTELRRKIRGRQTQIRELVDSHSMLKRKPLREQIKTAH